MGLILDTDHLIFFEKRGFTARQTLVMLGSRQPSEPIGISVVTLAELQHGVRRASTEKRRADRAGFLEDLMQTVMVFDLTPSIALRLGTVEADLEIAGNRLDLPDLIIGCTAVDLGYKLATMNVHHFDRIAGLSIVTLIDKEHRLI